MEMNKMKFDFSLSIIDNTTNLFEQMDFDIEYLIKKYGIVEIDGDDFINNLKV